MTINSEGSKKEQHHKKGLKFTKRQVKVNRVFQRQIMFVADFLYVNYVFKICYLLSIMLTKDK